MKANALSTALLSPILVVSLALGSGGCAGLSVRDVKTTPSEEPGTSVLTVTIRRAKTHELAPEGSVESQLRLAGPDGEELLGPFRESTWTVGGLPPGRCSVLVFEKRAGQTEPVLKFEEALDLRPGLHTHLDAELADPKDQKVLLTVVGVLVVAALVGVLLSSIHESLTGKPLVGDGRSGATR